MTLFSPNVSSWMFETPEQAVGRQALRDVSDKTAALLLISSLLSFALAETLMGMRTWAFLGLEYVCALFIFIALTAIYSRIARIIVGPVATFGEWLYAGLFALLPVHLLLPAALIGRSMGPLGAFFFALMKLGVYFILLERAVGVVAALTGWSRPAAIFLIVSPFLVSLCLLALAFVGILAVLACAMTMGAAA
jgi:hypothetical protein